MAHHGEEGVEAEAEVGAEAEEATKWRTLIITGSKVVGAAVVVVAEVGVAVGTVVEAESKTQVALTSLMLMELHEVGGLTSLRRPHTQVAAEEGAEAEVRVEVRGEGFALTDLRKIKLSQ